MSEKQRITMDTPTDTEILDYLDNLPAEPKWEWQLQHKLGCIFLDKNTSIGTQTVREAVILHMEKERSKES
jgi:hypothetical protein